MCCCGVCASNFESIPGAISTTKSSELYTVSSSQKGFCIKNLASQMGIASMPDTSKQDTSQTITINQPSAQNGEAIKPIVIEIQVKQVEENSKNNAAIYKELLYTLEKIREMLDNLHETQAKEIKNLTNETMEKQNIINNLMKKIAELDSDKILNHYPVEIDNIIAPIKKVQEIDESQKINDNLEIVMSTSLEQVLEKMISENSNTSYSKEEMKSLMQQIFSQCTVINAKSSPALHTLISNLSNPLKQINNEESSRNTLNSEPKFDSSSSNPVSSTLSGVSEKDVTSSTETNNIKKVSSTFQNIRYKLNTNASTVETTKGNDKEESASTQKTSTSTNTLSDKWSSIKATLSRKDVSVQCVVRDIISKLCFSAISKARNAARQLLSRSDQETCKPEKVEITMTVPFDQLISGDSMQSTVKISPKVEIAKEVTPVMVSKSTETNCDPRPLVLADKKTQVCGRRIKRRALRSLQSSQIIKNKRGTDQRRFVIKGGEMGGDRLIYSLENQTPRISRDYANSTEEPVKRDYVNRIHFDNTHNNTSQPEDNKNYPIRTRTKVNSSSLKLHANSSLDKTICSPADIQSTGDMACQTFRSLKCTALDVKNCSDGMTIIGSNYRKNTRGSDCIIINDVPERDSDNSSNSWESNGSVNY